jgi:ATP-dependent RNA helicase DDX52/ROK1
MGARVDPNAGVHLYFAFLAFHSRGVCLLQVEDLARSVLQQPIRITVGIKNAAVSNVKQRLLFVGRESGKAMALRQLLADGLKPPVLVFVGTKERAQSLHR